LTFTNPSTILSFAAIFAGMGLGAATSFESAGAMVAGVFCGSGLWWLLLSQGVARLRSRLTPAWMARVNQFSGVIIFAFGVWALSR
jgi:putative LysE/RhtB family amino acid efflux pump